MNLPDDQTQIIMKVDIEDLKEIYFGKRNHIYFFGPRNKRESFWFIIALIIFPFFAHYFIQIKEGGILIFGSFWFALATYAYWRTAKTIIVWKKTVKAGLIVASKVKSLKFIFDDEFITHIQDESEVKMNWNDITHAIIADRFIELHSNTFILLPKNSMRPEEFENLSNKITEKVQKVIKI